MKRLLRKLLRLLFCLNVTLEFNNPSLHFSLIRLIIIFLWLTTNSTPLAASETDGRLDSVTLKLKWKHQFQFAGYYAALEKGFYRQEGLDVKIIEATEGEESTKTVLNGDAEFGTAMSDLVLLRAKGQPVVALAAIFQHSPFSILVPKSTGIQNIHDLSGRRIALEPHSEEIVAYMKHEGIPLSDMVVHAHTYDTSPLVNGDIDAMSAYSTDEPFMLLKKGVEYNVFSARSGGIDFYGDTLFTTEQQVREHPERVSAFLKASIAGWEYALSHSEEIIDLILSNYSRRHSREHLVFEAQQTERLIMADVVGIGYMNPGRWEHIADTYAELGMVDRAYSLKGFIYDPSPETDFRRLYIILAVVISIALLVFLIAAYFYKLNQSLKEEMKERHLAENALKKEKETLQKYLDIAGVMFVVLDNEGQVTLINRKGWEVLGYDQKDIIGKNWFDHFIPKRMRAEVKDVFSKIESAEAEITDYSENPVLTKSGHERIIYWHNTLLMDNAGQIIGTLSSGNDITERKQAEEALRKAHDELEMRVRERTDELQETNRQLQESEERLALIYDSTADILFYISVEPDDCFRFLSVNSAFFNATGMTQDQIVGKCIEEVIPENSIQLVLDNYRKSIREKRIVRWEETSVYPSGEKIVHVSIAPIFNEKGICTNLVGSLHDITEQRKAELNYRTVADFTYDWEYWAKMDGTLNYVSPSCKRISGYSVQDFMDNPSLFREHIVPQDREIWDRHYRDSRRELKPQEIQFRIQRRDGEIRWIEHACQPVTDNTGRNLGFRASNRDVSERKKMEEGLQQSKEFNRAILMSLSDHIAVLDREGNVLTVNDAWREFARKNDANFPDGAGPGANYFKICREASDNGDETAVEAVEGIRSVLDGSSTTFKMEYPCDSPTEKRWFLMSVSPFKGRKGGLVVTHSNITSRKQAEVRLKESEVKFRNLVEQSPLSIQIANPDGKVIQVNPAFLKLWGITESTLGEFYDKYNVLQDKYAKKIGVMPLLEKAYKNGEVVHLPSIQYDPIEMMKANGFDEPSGQKRWIQTSIYPIKDEGGRILNVIHIEEDITERKQSENILRQNEERYRGIFDESIAAIYVFDEKKNFVDSNQAGLDMLGYSRHELLSMSILDVDADPVVVLPAQEQLLSGESILNYEHQLKRKDGTIITVLNNSRPLTDAEGNVVGMQSTLLDITERKKAEEAIQRYQQRLKALASQLTIAEESERRRIATDLHDHVGQSLALARIQLAAARKSTSMEKRNTMLDETSETLLRTIQGTKNLIFELSTPSMNELGLGAAISEWLEDYIGGRYGLKTEFIDEIDDSLTKTLNDHVRAILFRNVRELLANVVKHAHANWVRVSMAQAEGSMRIVVQDDGVGFNAREISRTAGMKGSYGLFSIEEHMTNLGGSLEIVSEPGKGCKAILRVPMEARER